ncbi:hypothetical protein, partial [Mariniphaga sediminis]|uniref:hypothetical protein n=1 Tax=Mariniphaga sediminis TaxID=1628158 RepID=UPI00356221AC
MKQIFLSKLYVVLMATLFTVHSVAQDNMLCVGRHWTEDEANLKMKEFAAEWNNLKSWEQRAATIKEG